MKLPRIEWITDEIIKYRDYLKEFNPAEIDDGEGNCGGDIRLQVRELENQDNSSWSIHTGDSSYDQDHRGCWGASFVSVDNTNKECAEIAKDLLEQVNEQDYEINS